MPVMPTNRSASPRLTIPSGAPAAKFVRYAHAVSKDHPLLFPITPATRPLTVGVDLGTLRGNPTVYPDLVHTLRRSEVSPKLLVRRDDDPTRAEPWTQACKIDQLHTIGFTDAASAQRTADALEFAVTTTRAGETTASRRCHLSRSTPCWTPTHPPQPISPPTSVSTQPSSLPQVSGSAPTSS